MLTENQYLIGTAALFESTYISLGSGLASWPKKERKEKHLADLVFLKKEFMETLKDYRAAKKRTELLLPNYVSSLEEKVKENDSYESSGNV